MKKKGKGKWIIIAVVVVFFLIIAGSGDGSEKSLTGIRALTIEDLSEKEFYSYITYERLDLEVDNTTDYDTDDVNVVVLDDSIIDITYEKKESFFSEYISFTINCKSPGSTKFYFETSDKVIKSEEVEITVQPNIESISFSDTSEITFYSWDYSDEEIFFDVESYEYISDIENYLEFISEDSQIATIKYDGDSWSDKCVIENVGVGETYVYIQTKDQSIQSEKIKIIVEPEEEEEEFEEPTTTKKTGRTVYTTPYGEKYHYSSSCAGKNATPNDYYDVCDWYDPCKKCVG